MSKIKNTLVDLNNHLFEQMERLNDDSLTGEALDRELKRADGMYKISTQIIQNGELAFKTMRHRDMMGGDQTARIPDMLENKGDG